jgi:hypothetical protein
MAADDFFSRWSKGKPASGDPAQQSTPPATEALNSPALPDESAPPPTLEDVAKLTHESDFSRFVGRDVDDAVKRSAMKKLFSNPHFNVMDGLDIYIDDYTKFTPLTPTMLASLKHAKDLLNPVGAQKQDLLFRDEDQADPQLSSPAAGNGAPASEGSPAENGQQTTVNDGDTATPIPEDSSSSGSPEETASSTEVKDKPLSQGGS